MSNSSNLIDALKNFSSNSVLSKNDKIFLKENLESLQEHMTKKESDDIKPIIGILEKGRLGKADKDIISGKKNQ